MHANLVILTAYDDRKNNRKIKKSKEENEKKNFVISFKGAKQERDEKQKSKSIYSLERESQRSSKMSIWKPFTSETRF